MELKTMLILSGAVLFLAIAVWIFRDKDEKAIFMPLRLFPRWVKYIGLAWAILSIILPIAFNMYFNGKNYLGVQLVAIGLLLICFSRDKVEDEMTNVLRLKSFYRSVFLGFSAVVLLDVVEILVGGSSITPSFSLISIVLSLYLVNFYIAKSKIRSEK